MTMLEGGCLCGAIRFRVSGGPRYSAICHCNSCRRASSAPSVAWQTFERRHFEVLSGRPRSYRSSAGVERTFCDNCGSALTYRTEQRPEHIDVTSVSLDDPELAPPDREVFTAERLSWQPLDPARRQFEQGGE
jgi:hypothetical protein